MRAVNIVIKRSHIYQLSLLPFHQKDSKQHTTYHVHIHHLALERGCTQEEGVVILCREVAELRVLPHVKSEKRGVVGSAGSALCRELPSRHYLNYIRIRTASATSSVTTDD